MCSEATRVVGIAYRRIKELATQKQFLERMSAMCNYVYTFKVVYRRLAEKVELPIMVSIFDEVNADRASKKVLAEVCRIAKTEEIEIISISQPTVLPEDVY